MRSWGPIAPPARRLPPSLGARPPKPPASLGMVRPRRRLDLIPPLAPPNPVNGDVLSVTINTEAGGLSYATVTIKGFGTGATYDFGFAASNNNDPRTARVRFLVRSEGFDANGSLTTVDRVVYGTRVMRKAFPNDAQLDEAASGSDLVVKVALSEVIYDDDRDGGAGTSGRNPIFVADAGWCRNAANGQPVAASRLSCTNSSTSDYRLPFGQWDPQTTMPAVRQTANFVVGFTPRHTHGVACVRFDVTGVTSGHVQTAYSYTLVPRQRSGSTLWAEAMEAGIAIAGYTQGEAMDLRCRVYPTVGDTAFDTEGYTTTGEEVRGCNKIRQYCDKTNTPNLAVVNFSTGNDGTAVTSTTLATANASPYLNIGKAIQGLGAGGGIVYVRTGTGSAIGSQPAAVYSNTFWTEVRCYPGEEGTVTLTVGAFFTNLPLRLRYSGFTYKLSANNVGLYGNNSTTFLWFDSITFDANGFATTNPLSDYMAGCYMTNCTGIDVDKWDDFLAGSDRCAVSIDGCSLSDSNNSKITSSFHRFVANTGTDMQFLAPATANPAPDADNLLFEFNRLTVTGSAKACSLKLVGDRYVSAQTIGISVCGNVLEATEGTTPMLELFDGGTPEIATSNVIVESNTIAGQRQNCGYNDAGSVAYPRLGWSVKNNSFRDWNVKGDEFVTGNGARTGAWPIQYGQNMAGNRYETAGFPGMFVGLNTDTTSTMNYTTNASATGTDSGGGDYKPAAGSDLLGSASQGQVRWDLFGRAVVNDVGGVQA
jgi:hypothetical protein